MAHPLVVHCKRKKYDVYIGRGACPLTGRHYGWGNQFEIGKDGDRTAVIAKYEAWLRAELLKNPQLAAAVLALKGKVLGCWCHPHACHGDVLARIANA